MHHQLLKGAPDSLLRSLHIKKEPTAFSYIKVGGQIKVAKNNRAIQWAYELIEVHESPNLQGFFPHRGLQVLQTNRKKNCVWLHSELPLYASIVAPF